MGLAVPESLETGSRLDPDYFWKRLGRHFESLFARLLPSCGRLSPHLSLAGVPGPYEN